MKIEIIKTISLINTTPDSIFEILKNVRSNLTLLKQLDVIVHAYISPGQYLRLLKGEYALHLRGNKAYENCVGGWFDCYLFVESAKRIG